MVKHDCGIGDFFELSVEHLAESEGDARTDSHCDADIIFNPRVLFLIHTLCLIFLCQCLGFAQGDHDDAREAHEYTNDVETLQALIKQYASENVDPEGVHIEQDVCRADGYHRNCLVD